jgi:hypothetical protein
MDDAMNPRRTLAFREQPVTRPFYPHGMRLWGAWGRFRVAHPRLYYALIPTTFIGAGIVRVTDRTWLVNLLASAGGNRPVDFVLGFLASGGLALIIGAVLIIGMRWDLLGLRSQTAVRTLFTVTLFPVLIVLPSRHRFGPTPWDDAINTRAPGFFAGEFTLWGVLVGFGLLVLLRRKFMATTTSAPAEGDPSVAIVGTPPVKPRSDRISPLCTSGEHEVCARLPYTGCACSCHPERRRSLDQRPTPGENTGPTAGPAPDTPTDRSGRT